MPPHCSHVIRQNAPRAISVRITPKVIESGRIPFSEGLPPPYERADVTNLSLKAGTVLAPAEFADQITVRDLWKSKPLWKYRL
jgi:hypothetical protein